MVGEVEGVTQHHADPGHLAGLTPEAQGDHVGELPVLELPDGVRTERKRRLEFRYQIVLGPGRLDRVGGGGVFLRQRSGTAKPYASDAAESMAA